MTAKPKRKVQKFKTKVTDIVSEKAGGLNPLTPRAEAPAVPESVPKITNETITEHREEVLSGARKYIYPLAHSKHRIIVITTGIIMATLAAFLIYCFFALYKLYQYNSFLYRVSQVIPFPIARAGDNFVDYENYLFELRHYVHYYENQLQADFEGSDKQRLVEYRKQALQDTIDAAYVKMLAKQNNISVSDREVNDRIEQVRNQNRLGSDNKVFADVLRDYWGWSVNDFKRSLKQQILAEKVTAALDKTATAKAESILRQLKKGASFEVLAKKYSDDASTKGDGGQYGRPITKTNPNVPPQVVDALFSLKPKQFSGILIASPVLASNSPTLEIVRLTDNDGSSVSGGHISITLKDLAPQLAALKKKYPAKTYVNFK